jgi:hypothetical protein
MTAAQVQPIGFASKDLRWPLYHGTSTLALKAIRKEKRLRISPVGEQAFFMTTEKRMAEDFACSAVLVDIDRREMARRRHGEAIPASRPVVLVLDGERLLSLKYPLRHYKFPYHQDAGLFYWENEIYCGTDIRHLDEVLIAVEPVRRKDVDSRGIWGSGSSTPSAAGGALEIMSLLVRLLKRGEITEQFANGIATAVRSETAAQATYPVDAGP